MTALWPHVTFEIYLRKQAQCITCVLVGALCHTFLALIPSPFFSVVCEFPIPPPTMPSKENLEGNNSGRKRPQNASAETEEQRKKKRTTKYLWLTHILLKLNPWLSLGIRNQKGSTKWSLFVISQNGSDALKIRSSCLGPFFDWAWVCYPRKMTKTRTSSLCEFIPPALCTWTGNQVTRGPWWMYAHFQAYRGAHRLEKDCR